MVYRRGLSYLFVVFALIVLMFTGCAGTDVKKTVDVYANVNTMIHASAKVTKDMCSTGILEDNTCLKAASMYNSYVQVDHAFNDSMVTYLEALKMQKDVVGQEELEKLATEKVEETFNNLDENKKRRAILMANLVQLFMEIGTWEGDNQQ